jgi:hypothetical protein
MRKYRPRIYYTEADKALMWDRVADNIHAENDGPAGRHDR